MTASQPADHIAGEPGRTLLEQAARIIDPAAWRGWDSCGAFALRTDDALDKARAIEVLYAEQITRLQLQASAALVALKLAESGLDFFVMLATKPGTATHAADAASLAVVRAAIKQLEAARG